MTATTTDTESIIRDVESRTGFAATLRTLANAIGDGDLSLPTSHVRLYMTRFDSDGKAAFLAAARLFPAATVKVDDETYGYVELRLNEHAVLLFDKQCVGVQTTVKRDVVEYVLDPELLAAMAS